ncbi:MAG: hypothetical protein U0325_16570 [Polyangiales bacterium]
MRFSLLAAAVWMLACRHESVAPEPSPPSSPSRPSPAPSAPAVAARPVAAQGDPRVTDPVPAAPTGSPRAVTLRDVLPPASRAALDATTVPLLLPDDVAIAARALVTSGERWVAASIPQADHTIAIHATRETMAPPADGPAHRSRLRGVPATVTANEGVRVATWMEDGVAYMIDVECTRPAEDVRCTGEAFIRGLAERLVRVESAR